MNTDGFTSLDKKAFLPHLIKIEIGSGGIFVTFKRGENCLGNDELQSALSRQWWCRWVMVLAGGIGRYFLSEDGERSKFLS